jgi:hypothetical protein
VIGRSGINVRGSVFLVAGGRPAQQEHFMGRSNLSRLAAIGAVTLILALSGPAMAVDTGGDGGSSGGGSSGNSSAGGGSSVSVPTLADARADIAAKKWTAAITKLKSIVADNSSNADAYNLLGYSYRNAGDFSRAMTAYKRALKLNPKHTGALEYQGVLFIKLGQVDNAKANLDKIKGLCGTGCEEYEDLAKAIGS